MLGFDDVLNVRLGALDDAVSDWTATVKRLRHLAEEDAPAMRRKSDQADWKGENAAVTKPFVRKTVKEFDDALKEATSIRNILRDAKKKFAEHRTALQNLIEEAPEHQVHIDARGTVRSTKVQAPLSADYWQNTPALAPQHTDDKAVTAMAGRIKKVLEAATHDDELVAEALNAIVGDNPHDFTQNSMGGIKDAQALEDAETALELAGKGGELTEKELTSLNRLLKKNSGNPWFAERFAVGLGAGGTLQFWAEAADTGQAKGARLAIKPDEDRVKELKALQKNLSEVLGTATHSDSREMQAWKKDVIKLSNERIDCPQNDSPYGAQVMSNLMRQGEFDSQFLKDYGNNLIKLEQRSNSAVHNAGHFWTWESQSDLNFGAKDDRGNDPMTGFMEALGHNPEASTEFFSSKKNFDYLLGDRDWPADAPPYSDAKEGAGHRSLSHALMSATTGHNYDEPPPSRIPAHTAEQAKIMEKLVHGIAYPGDKIEIHPGMHETFGKMSAEYMADLNYAIAGGPKGGETLEDLYPPMGERAQLDIGDTTRFLYAVGRDPDGYAAITFGQTSYTGDMINYHFSHPDAYSDDGDVGVALEDVTKYGATVEGIVDQARFDAVVGDKEVKNTEFNGALKEGGEWAKQVFGIGVGLGTSSISSPVAGAVAAALANNVGGKAIDAVVGGLSREVSEMDIYKAESDIDDNSDSTTAATLKSAALADRENPSGLSKAARESMVRDGVEEGQGRAAVLLGNKRKS
ncbi:DUF6571 family protein [Streptomyces sp. TP-A0874]|uniref:DUF6571 family protein n=1 Tax=Streptomyces sp. TP-A0874 TaxID=549819 RepID=UPI000852BACE|nr:DUF6571 family protein [Streptomyces sp. TP-A0874]